MSSAKLIYATSKRSADLYYATKFAVPDPVIYIDYRDKKTLILSDLEIDRAKKQAKVDYCHSLSKYAKIAKQTNKSPTIADVIHAVLKAKKINKLVMPKDTSFTLVDGLRKRGYEVKSGTDPFYPERLIKNSHEIAYIKNTQNIVFQGMQMVHDILAQSKIKRNQLVYKGRALTSEQLRKILNVFLMERGCLASDTIIACGQHSIDPHDIGQGYLRPHQAIIIDVFPRSLSNMYYSDATRTFCRGQASPKLREMYEVVKQAQKMAISKVKDGINGRIVHETVQKFFDQHKYPTLEKQGRKQGFFHSTGHGIGLELHEEPVRIGPKDYKLKKGHVVSVEPGLYYSGIGGVRLEDLVAVTKGSCEVLGSFPKKLEIGV
ncbi:MAG: Xaa-Pro peptidase family protein [Pseudomonadota bacterium]